MTKNLVNKLYVVIFMLIFVIMTGIMVVGMINQNKEEKADRARYEQMIKEGSKTVLTDAILDEDFSIYVEQSQKSTKIFVTLLACFAAVILAFVVMMIFNVILRGMEEGASSTSFIIMLVSFIGAMFMIVSFLIISVKFLVPRFQSFNPEEEKYYFTEIVLTNAERIEKQETVKDGDSYRTETRVYYYFYTKNGEQISTSKLLYERYIGEGIYYVGKTSRGNIFSLYPDKYFELTK
ncbi:MAG: hypothetical protein J6P37_05470 [Lachnospiraceae bacterium]|nr:hypothetical protein [Lachnospiraceae bacterium]